MKLLAAILALALPVLALAAPATYSDTAGGVKSVCATSTCDAPTEAASLTDGVSLVSAVYRGLTITVCADSGQTLSGAGTLTAYSRDPSVGLWASLPDLNISMSTSARRCQSFASPSILVPAGRITWVPTGVTVSGGGVTVYISRR